MFGLLMSLGDTYNIDKKLKNYTKLTESKETMYIEKNVLNSNVEYNGHRSSFVRGCFGFSLILLPK